MKPIAASLLAAVALLVAPRAHAALRVVATVPDLAAVAREIAGDAASVSSMALAAQDPHFVDAKPNLLVKLNRADLLLLVGLDLEAGWLPPLLAGARNAKIQPGSPGYLDCSTFVQVREAPGGPIDPSTRSMGTIHPEGNPHYMVDPHNGQAVARGVAARLAQLDGANAAVYQQRLDAFIRKTDGLIADWNTRMAPYRGSPMVGFHKSWVYLSSWLGFEEVGFIEPKPGIPPSAGHVAEVIALARQKKVKLVLQEIYYADTTPRVVAEKIPAALVKVPGGTDFRGGQTYPQHIEAIVVLLESALGGKGG